MSASTASPSELAATGASASLVAADSPVVAGSTSTALQSSAAVIAARPDTAANVKLLAQWMQAGLGAGKKVFDATSYMGEQDLRPFGFEPLYLADDGDLNRTVYPEQQLSVPTASNYPAVEKAYRAVAHAATGVSADLFNHHLRYPNYDRTNQTLAIDVEADAFDALDAMADPVQRRTLIQYLCRLMDGMKQEQAATGATAKGIGLFQWPPAFWSGAHTAERPAALAQAQRDFQPLVDRVDAFFPEVYIHSDDTAKWLIDFRGTIAACRAAAPNKPIYAFVCPHYGHNATAAQMGQPLSPSTWRFVMETVLRETDGAAIWGGGDHRPTGDILTPLPWGTPLPLPQKAVLGDVDRNGVVNAGDLVVTRNNIGLKAGSIGTQLPTPNLFADVDGSGSIDAADLVIIRNHLGDDVLTNF